MVKPTDATIPGAWIVTNNRKDKSQPSDKGRKSIKNGKVYLDDGTEFEIELHNPLTECVLCDIKLNGQSISKNGLVLKPGQRFYLDCFIDDKKKFVFNTYEVEDTQEASDSIAKNGLLEVFFYKEDVVQINDWRRRFDRVIVERHYYPQYYPYWVTYPNIYYGTPTLITCGSTTGGISATTNLVNNNFTNTSGTYNSGTTLNGSIGSPTTTNTSSFSSNAINNQGVNAFYSNTSNTVDLSGLSLNSSSTKVNANIETGRVEKGTASSQRFKEIDMQFQSMYISQTILQLLPSSVKPVEVKELVKEKEESNDVIELIKKLADLHSAGILTDDEFNNKKSELLSKI